MRAACGAIAVIVLSSLAAGCGEGDDPQAVRDAIARLQRAFVARDAQTVSATLTPGAARHVGRIGHLSPKACTRDVRGMMGSFELVRADVLARERPVIEVEVDGDTAVATIALGRGAVGRVPLAKHDGEWRVDVSTASCPDRSSRTTTSRGWLETTNTTDGGLRVAVAGITGNLPIGSCRVYFVLHVSADGETVMEDLNFWGPNPCGDVQPCSKKTAVGVGRWRGRLHAGPSGAFVNRVSACLNTCVGIFRGELELDLRSTPRGWRMSARRQFVGASGFSVDGAVSVDTDSADAFALRGS